MTALIDDLGIWVQLGTVQPQFIEWIAFPVQSNTGNTTFRVSYQANIPNIKTRVYLRAVYQQLGTKIVDAQWIRLFPKLEKEIIEIPISKFFGSQSTLRSIEVIKKLKYRRIGYTVNEEPYLVSLEEFLPFPETIDAVNNLPQLQGVIQTEISQLGNELSRQIADNITQQVTATVQQINQQYDVIISLLSGSI